MDSAFAEAVPRTATAARRPCLHCGQRREPDEATDFCCTGCASVYELLRASRLGRYYELRGPTGSPVLEVSRRRDRKWLELLAARVAQGTSSCRLEVDVQGMHCSACVWLIEELFRREPDARGILVNPSLGRLVLTVSPAFPLQGFVERVEAFGYLLGPRCKDDTSAARGLLLRFGVCVALTMNAMIFSVAIYAGLVEGTLHRLFDSIDLGLATAAVLVGGSVFFRAAWQGVRQRALHLDLPIALGIAASYGGSVHAYLTGRAPYFDTLCVFVTLMLLGRFLQQRVLERNQRQLLGDGGAGSLLTRRRLGDVTSIVPCASLAVGDDLVIAPGDLVPVDAALVSETAECSLDWVNGESRSRSYAAHDVLPAGAFNAGPFAVIARCTTTFADSPVTDILRTPARQTARRGARGSFLQRLAPIYVAVVLLLATLAFGFWLSHSHDLGRALSVATGMLVVTCPCAFGIATPLAYELVFAGLRRRGLFVRSQDFLDKASQVRRVVFDKTGTLTEGALEIEGWLEHETLASEERSVLLAMVAASAHPKSEVVREWLSRRGAKPRPDLRTREVAGVGLEAEVDGHVYRFGAALLGPHRGDICFTRDDVPLASIRTRERLRKDAAREVRALEKHGYDVWILSGDEPERVRQIASEAGVSPEHAVGARSAEGKAEWLRSHDRRDTLMVGDGINDLAAVAGAFCSGTPATDRPFVASRADFYFVSPGLGPIRTALSASNKLAKVVRRNLAVATAYNAVAVSLVFAGVMSPFVCAVLMPVSSLSTILTTAFSLSERSGTWRS